MTTGQTLTTTNDGQVAYSILKAASVIVAIGAAILAIVVWAAETVLRLLDRTGGLAARNLAA